MTAQDVVGRWGLLPKCGFREDPGTIDQIVVRGFLASGAARPDTVLQYKAELVRRPLGITTATLPASPDPPTLGPCPWAPPASPGIPPAPVFPRPTGGQEVSNRHPRGSRLEPRASA